MTIEAFIKETQKKFTKIDKNIAELRACADELTAQINTTENYSLKDMRNSAVLRQELALISEALDTAAKKREEMVAEVSECIYDTLWQTRKTFIESLNAENSGLKAEIFTASKQLRALIKRADEADSAARKLYNSSIDKLWAFASEDARRSAYMFGVSERALDIRGDSADADIIKFIQDRAARSRTFLDINQTPKAPSSISPDNGR